MLSWRWLSLFKLSLCVHSLPSVILYRTFLNKYFPCRLPHSASLEVSGGGRHPVHSRTMPCGAREGHFTRIPEQENNFSAICSRTHVYPAGLGLGSGQHRSKRVSGRRRWVALLGRRLRWEKRSTGQGADVRGRTSRPSGCTEAHLLASDFQTVKLQGS